MSAYVKIAGAIILVFVVAIAARKITKSVGDATLGE